jgi:hypothetical protein
MFLNVKIPMLWGIIPDAVITCRLEQFNINEVMGKNLIILTIFVLAVIGLLILLLRKNRKDRKGLFKKLPGDYPDPENVESEIELERKKSE